MENGITKLNINVQLKYGQALSAFFFGRQPSAKAEAMGKGMVATGAGAFAAFYNPASISQNRNLVFSMSHASPYYALNDANYKFIGATYDMGKYGVLGLSHYRLHLADITVSTMLNPLEVKESKLTNSMYTLTFSKEILEDLYAGLNFNMIRDKSAVTGKSNQVDIGLLKYFEYGEDQKIGVGASLYNITNSEIVYKFENSTTSNFRETLPVSLHLGISYQHSRGKSTLNSFELNTFTALLQLEYQHLLNSRYYDGVRAGAEVSLIEMLFFRFGYYTEDINNFGSPDVNRSILTDFTYGFGFEIPLSKFTNGKTAIDLLS